MRTQRHALAEDVLVEVDLVEHVELAEDVLVEQSAAKFAMEVALAWLHRWNWKDELGVEQVLEVVAADKPLTPCLRKRVHDADSDGVVRPCMW